jgi:nucleoid-associated protein YgaU
MDKIEDPEWIWPDTVLVVPRSWPKSYTVKPDEYLSLIAGYWEIYGNPMEWTKLYEANKDKIHDPALIHPDEVLEIPR